MQESYLKASLSGVESGSAATANVSRSGSEMQILLGIRRRGVFSNPPRVFEFK